MRYNIQTEEEIRELNADRIKELQEARPECSGEPIIHFEGEYKFLSNFWRSPMKVRNYSFQNGESAFQGFKDMKRITEFESIKPSEAKKLGRKVKLRDDWEWIKNGIMEEVVRAKFTQNRELADKLLATENRLLVEGNWWNDRIWGVSNGTGENRLGEILMNVRLELQNMTPTATNE